MLPLHCRTITIYYISFHGGFVLVVIDKNVWFHSQKAAVLLITSCFNDFTHQLVGVMQHDGLDGDAGNEST